MGTTPAWSESGDVDRELLQRIAGGDAGALEALFTRYASPARALVFRILQDAAETDEVLSDVFWQVWREAARYEPSRGSPPAWIFTLARSRAIDRARSRMRGKGRTISLDDPEARVDPMDEERPPDEVVSFRQTRDALRSALTTLPAAQRQAVELAFLRGLTHAEIAERLGEPLGTIKTRIRQGLIKLRKHLD